MKPNRLYCLVLLLLLAAAPASSQEHVDRTLRLEAVEINGNQRATDNIILGHLLPVAPGEPVTAPSLQSARNRLLSTDYFSEVRFSTRPGIRRGGVVLVIDIKEKSYPGFETGYGYHDLYGWFLTLGGLRFDNSFGVESRLRIGLRLGWRLAGVDAEWTQPLSRDGLYGLDARLYSYSTDQRFYATADAAGPPADGGAALSEYQQKIDRAGGEISFGVGYRRAARFSFGFRAEAIRPDSAFSDVDSGDEFGYSALPPALGEQLGHESQTGLFLRVVRDTRDSPVYPTTGTFARFSLVSNNTWLGGDQIFTRTELDANKHVSVSDGWVLSGRLAGGVVSTGTPYYDRFYIGGIYSIRGFAAWSLSAPGGDDGYWLANAEIRWRLAGGTHHSPRVIGLVFVDAGQGYRRDESFDAEDIHVGSGYGLRFRLPWVGTLGLDVGIPLTDDRTGDPFQIHGSLGFSF
jgi:outer membrane protein insertion porin family